MPKNGTNFGVVAKLPRPGPLEVFVRERLGTPLAGNPVHLSCSARLTQLPIRTICSRLLLCKSLFRLSVWTSGGSPPDTGVKTDLATPFKLFPSCRFSRLQGFASIWSPLPPVLRPGLVPLLSLTPSGFFTFAASVSVTSPCHSCLLLRSVAGSTEASAGFATACVCSSPSCDASEPLPSWAFRPPGNSPDSEPSTASGRFPTLRFDGLWVLLSESVGICKSCDLPPPLLGFWPGFSPGPFVTLLRYNRSSY